MCMIKSISLENFQSHKNTTIELSDKITAVVGPSDSGKSAVIRGLLWVLKNNLRGHGYISSWAKQSTVSMEVGKKKLSRIRSKKENNYLLESPENTEVFEAVKSDVPVKLVETGEENIQSQHDPIFMLSKTPGEIARYFNSLIDLDAIDKCLSSIDQKKRRVKNEITIKSETITSTQKKIVDLAWVDRAQKLCDRAAKYAESIPLCAVELSKAVDTTEKWTALLEDIEDVEKRLKLVESKHKMQCFEDNISIVSETIEKLSSLNAGIQKAERFSSLHTNVKTLSKFSKACEITSSELKDCSASMDSIQSTYEQIEESEEIIERLTAELPSVCPVCGGEM